MPADGTTVTAFMLVKTTPEWLAMTVTERVLAFTTQVGQHHPHQPHLHGQGRACVVGLDGRRGGHPLVGAATVHEMDVRPGTCR